MAVDPSTEKMKPLALSVVYASSEDERYPAQELNKPNALRGWQSSRLPDTPQELGFRFDGEVSISQLQIVAHQSKTPTRVDVYVCSLDSQGYDSRSPPGYHEARFSRLGYLSFANNEGAKYRSRERKNVHLSTHAFYLKLVIHKCWSNSVNLYNQVGIVSVAAFGDVLTPAEAPRHHSTGLLPPVRPPKGPAAPMGDDPPWAQQQQQASYVPLPPIQNQQQHHHSPQPPPQAQRGQAGNARGPAQEAMDHRPGRFAGHDNVAAVHHNATYVDPATASATALMSYRSHSILQFEAFYVARSKELTLRKAHSVSVEDFDGAKRCKEELEALQRYAERIYELESAKLQRILEEDFDSCAVIKRTMDGLIGDATSGVHAGSGGGGGHPHHPSRRSSVAADAVMANNRNGGWAHGASETAAGGASPSTAHTHPQPQPAAAGRNRRHHQDEDVDEQDPYDSDHGRGGARGGPHDPTPRKHAFDDQPVVSKYAQMMAEQARQQHGKDGSPVNDEESDAVNASGDGRRGTHDAEDAHDEDEDQEQEEPEEEEEDNDDDDEDDDENERKRRSKAQKAPAAKGSPNKGRKQQPSSQARSSQQQPAPPRKASKRDDDEDENAEVKDAADTDSQQAASPSHGRGNEDEEDVNGAGAGLVVGAFDVDKLPDWERDVYYAIHDEIGPDTPTAPAEPVDAQEGVSEYLTQFGHYCAACLFSKRWKLREAALKVIAAFFTHYFKHGSPVTRMNVLLKYFDLKGFGLLDPISNVYFATCDVLVRLVEGRIDDCPLSSVQHHVTALLPRVLLRASDATPKTRDEALSLMFLLAASSIGPERIALAVLADPVDHNKRRVPPTNVKVAAARLTVMHNLVTNHHIGNRLAVDALMTKLILPSLNAGTEARDLAVAVIGSLDPARGPEVAKFLHLVANPNTRAIIEDKLSLPPTQTGGGTTTGGDRSTGPSDHRAKDKRGKSKDESAEIDPSKPGKQLPARKQKPKESSS